MKIWLLELKRKILAALKNRDNMLVLSAVLAAVTVMLLVTAAFMLKPANYNRNSTQGDGTVGSDNLFRHPLTGAVLDAPLNSLPQVYAVMIENSADAWPLSGLEDAFLVIEAPVEGAIPRFEAFFSSENEVSKIGPVRSARPYYLDWATEFDALYVHVGGSPEALGLIADRGMLDLNEFFQGEYFWRDTLRRFAPHNVYTSTELLGEALDELEPEVPEYDSWIFKTDTPLDVEPLSVTIDWGQGSLYDVTWAYVAGSNSYIRKQGATEVVTADGDQVLANNVVVIAADITVIDSLTRRRIVTIAEGDALIVQDGRIMLGRWKKSGVDERLRFYSAAGQEIEMNAGKTWIEVVPSLDKVETVNEGL